MVDGYDELHILLKIMKRNSTSMVDMEDKYHNINRCRYIYIRIIQTKFEPGYTSNNLGHTKI